MKFTKMHGLGNDFVVIAEFSAVPEGISELAQKICDRHFGVGADGLVLILPSERADFRMRIFNSDGSEPEQCGNAVRCVGKYVYDYGMIDRDEVTVETGAGVQRLKLFVENDQVVRVTVDMGRPILEAAQIPTAFSNGRVIRQPLMAEEEEFLVTAVSMGNPHAVIFVDDLAKIDLHRIGPKLETHEMFPRKTNVEFVQVHSPTEVTMHVWERGAGETLACGSGACAVGVAGVLNGFTERNVLVHLKGGDLLIEWKEEDQHVYMTGPAVSVFEGRWLLD
jgi:diaminopimelate epimerase